MNFTILDNKKDCLSIFSGGNFYLNSKEFPNNLSATWSYHPYFDKNVEYANLYCLGKKMIEICPDNLKNEWTMSKEKYKAFLNSLKNAKVVKTGGCIFDFIPLNILSEYCKIKNNIIEHVISNYKKPLIYDILLKASEIAFIISQKNVNLNYSCLSEFAKENILIKEYAKRLSYNEPIVDYNIFGTITGRFTTKRNSFPILNLAKKYRKMIIPNNDYFIELDFNSAEPRTVYYFANKEQIEGDLHQWNIENIFQKNINRDEAKKLMFSYLYGYAENDKLDKVYKKNKILTYWNNNKIINFFGREIPVNDSRLAINYIIQSTTSDLFINQVHKVLQFLKDKKSFIAFTIHDSLIVDLAKEDKKYILEIIKLFSETMFGKYKVNVSIGKDFGNMKKVEL